MAGERKRDLANKPLVSAPIKPEFNIEFPVIDIRTLPDYSKECKVHFGVWQQLSSEFYGQIICLSKKYWGKDKNYYCLHLFNKNRNTHLQNLDKEFNREPREYGSPNQVRMEQRSNGYFVVYDDYVIQIRKGIDKIAQLKIKRPLLDEYLGFHILNVFVADNWAGALYTYHKKDNTPQAAMIWKSLPDPAKQQRQRWNLDFRDISANLIGNNLIILSRYHRDSRSYVLTRLMTIDESRNQFGFIPLKQVGYFNVCSSDGYLVERAYQNKKNGIEVSHIDEEGNIAKIGFHEFENLDKCIPAPNGNFLLIQDFVKGAEHNPATNTSITKYGMYNPGTNSITIFYLEAERALRNPVILENHIGFLLLASRDETGISYANLTTFPMPLSFQKKQEAKQSVTRSLQETTPLKRPIINIVVDYLGFFSDNKKEEARDYVLKNLHAAVDNGSLKTDVDKQAVEYFMDCVSKEEKSNPQKYLAEIEAKAEFKGMSDDARTLLRNSVNELDEIFRGNAPETKAPRPGPGPGNFE